MRNNTYEYETITKDNNKYTYKVINNNIEYPNIEIYINGTKWGSPQGERFIIALLDDIKKIKRQNEILKKNISTVPFDIEDVYKEYECDFK